MLAYGTFRAHARETPDKQPFVQSVHEGGSRRRPCWACRRATAGSSRHRRRPRRRIVPNRSRNSQHAFAFCLPMAATSSVLRRFRSIRRRHGPIADERLGELHSHSEIVRCCTQSLRREEPQPAAATSSEIKAAWISTRLPGCAIRKEQRTRSLTETLAGLA